MYARAWVAPLVPVLASSDAWHRHQSYRQHHVLSVSMNEVFGRMHVRPYGQHV
jgi:hypothetical protein